MSTVVFVNKLHNENNQQYAFRAIYRAIMNLELKPGEQISDSELCESLGSSRTPIREAILRLVELRLVDVQPQRSSIVSRINLDYVDEGVFVRNLLETAVLREAINKASAEDLSALRENLSLQRLRIEEKRYAEYVELDNDFHEIIYNAAGRALSWQAVSSTSTHLDRLRKLQNLAGSHTFETGYCEHMRLYDVIAYKEVLDYTGFVYQHITRGYRLVLPELMKEHPEYFETCTTHAASFIHTI